MDERERQIRELINNPGFPSDRISEGQLAGAMRREMLDGEFDRGTAEEMRKKLADQMFMDMRLRGYSKFGGLKATSPTRRPEDVPYSKADDVAAQALRSQRGITKLDLERHAKEPANYDPGRADFREAAAIGMPAGKDDYDARVQEIADQLFTQSRLEGRPISYEEARAVAMDRHNSYLKELRNTTYGPVGDEDMRFSEPVVYSSPDGHKYQPPADQPMSGDRVNPRLGPSAPPANPYASPATVRPFTGAASPKQPAYDTTTRSSADLDVQAQAEAAAAAIMAKQRAARRGNK